jgi:hypothetical protein
MSTQQLVYPFPIRNDLLPAQIVVPGDLTKEEADRLCAFIQALVIPAEVKAETTKENADAEDRIRDAMKMMGGVAP